MSNKVEAALGGGNTFTDEDGDVFTAELRDEWDEPTQHTIELRMAVAGKSGLEAIEFYKADATKIIALIAEAAK